LISLEKSNAGPVDLQQRAEAVVLELEEPIRVVEGCGGRRAARSPHAELLLVARGLVHHSKPVLCSISLSMGEAMARAPRRTREAPPAGSLANPGLSRPGESRLLAGDVPSVRAALRRLSAPKGEPDAPGVGAADDDQRGGQNFRPPRVLTDERG
jgi:hypothetical protein